MSDRTESPIRAIREKCFECQGGRKSPGYKKRVRECARVECALFPYRMGSNPRHKNREQPPRVKNLLGEVLFLRKKLRKTAAFLKNKAVSCLPMALGMGCLEIVA